MITLFSGVDSIQRTPLSHIPQQSQISSLTPASSSGRIVWMETILPDQTKHCNRCHRTLPVTAFHKDKSKPDGRNAYCKECNCRHSNTWYHQNPEKARAQRQRYYQGHKEEFWAANLRSRFGLSVENFMTVLEAQQHKCAICCGVFTSRPCVDHDHETGEIRGLLCGECNLGLGKFKDNKQTLQAAIEYLS